MIVAQTLRPLLKMALPVHVVHGNNLGDFLAMGRLCAASGDLVTYMGRMPSSCSVGGASS